MKVLLLAPHPFFQTRGTPIAVDLVLRVLSERGDRVDVITFPEGKDLSYLGVRFHRTPNLPMVRNIRPGFSWKKLVCDFCMLFMALRMVSRQRYDLIHAGEEAVFIGLLIKKIFKIPYVYDMDSSLAQQMTEKYPKLSALQSVLEYFEGIAVKNAKAVVPVCDALAVDIDRYRPEKVVVLPDISLLNYASSQGR